MQEHRAASAGDEEELGRCRYTGEANVISKLGMTFSDTAASEDAMSYLSYHPSQR